VSAADILERQQAVDTLPLSGRGARLVIWLSFAVYVVLAAWTIEGVRFPVTTVIALCLLALACLVMTLDRSEPLRLWVAVVAVATTPLNVVIVAPHVLHGGYVEWYLGAGAFILFYVALRGRRFVAWIGFFAMSVASITSYQLINRPLYDILLDLSRHASIVFIGTIFSLSFAATARTIATLARDAAARTAVEHAAETAAAVRAERLAWLEQLVGSLLRRIADGDDLSAADRAQSGRAEAELRDSLRGRALYREPLALEVRRARERGVHIAVLDDSSGGYGTGRLNDLAEKIAGHVAAAEEGKITIRLLPPGRDVSVTIVIDGDRAQRVELV
jgi:hypothetical protein